MEHQHNVQICAGCVAPDLQLALSLLRRHNATLDHSQQTDRAEAILDDTLEMIINAKTFLQTVFSPEWDTQEDGMGATAVHRERHECRPSGFRGPDAY